MAAYQFRRGTMQPIDLVAGLAALVVFGWSCPGLAAASSPAQAAKDAVEAAKHALVKSGPPPCASEEPRDDSGACPVVDDSPTTRGFELYSGTLPRASGRGAPIAGGSGAGSAIAAETAACGDGCDLKITFKSGSHSLSRRAQASLDQFATAMASPTLSEKRFEIAGHTDASGSQVQNEALSQARAEAVTGYLIAHGVPATRLVAKGYGSKSLLLQNIPLDPRNRRVEARVVAW